LLSAAGLRRIADDPPHGSDILLWFDMALALGLAVLPLAEPLLDGRLVDRRTHYVQDERARMTLWAGRSSPATRLLVEAAYGYMVRPHQLAATSPGFAPMPQPAALEDAEYYRYLYGSRSFRFGKAVMRALGYNFNLPEHPASGEELCHARSMLLQSAAWEVGAPIRLAAKFARRRLRHDR
jgi:hypothetical protein